MKKSTFGAIAGARRRNSSPGESIYNTWVARADAIGGTYTANSKSLALGLADAAAVESYYSEMVWMAPLLGGNLATMRVPLIDTLGVGAMVNNGFVDANFSEATGLTGTGAANLNTGILPSQLGTSGNGGLGYWARTVDQSGTNAGVMGMMSNLNSARFNIDLRNTTTLRIFTFGLAANAASSAVNAAPGFYYGQRSSATLRELTFNSSSIATNTTSDSAANASDQQIRLMGIIIASGEAFAKGSCSVALMTKGTLSSGNITSLQNLLQTYLITPTGR